MDIITTLKKRYSNNVTTTCNHWTQFKGEPVGSAFGLAVINVVYIVYTFFMPLQAIYNECLFLRDNLLTKRYIETNNLEKVSWSLDEPLLCINAHIVIIVIVTYLSIYPSFIFFCSH